MIVRVKLFAAARESVGNDELAVEVTDGASVADVRRAVEASAPALRSILPHCLWAVDAQYATPSTPIEAGSEVALIPPVSGG